MCYAPGTRILTQHGQVEVEKLVPGIGLATADHGFVPLRWIGRSHHVFGTGQHKHKPIEFKAGSLGRGFPLRTLVVSPQHRILFSGRVVADLFGTRSVLALAKALVGLDHVRTMNGKREITYFSLLCDRHEMLLAEGAWSESFYPGPTAMGMIGKRMRREIKALFPSLLVAPDTGYGPPVRRVLNRRETERLVNALKVHCTGNDAIGYPRPRREFGSLGAGAKDGRINRPNAALDVAK